VFDQHLLRLLKLKLANLFAHTTNNARRRPACPAISDANFVICAATVELLKNQNNCSSAVKAQFTLETDIETNR